MSIILVAFPAVAQINKEEMRKKDNLNRLLESRTISS